MTRLRGLEIATKRRFGSKPVDCLIAKRDPVDPEALVAEGVGAALLDLHDAVLEHVREHELYAGSEEADGTSSGVAARAPRSSRPWRPPGRRRLAFAAAASFALTVLCALLPGSSIRGDQLGAVSASAAVVLDHAADAALSRNAVFPSRSQYQYVKLEEGGITDIVRGRLDVYVRDSQVREDWYRSSGPGRERVTETGRAFLTARDSRLARAAGESLNSLLPNQSSHGSYRSGGFGVTLVNPARRSLEPRAVLQALVRSMDPRGTTVSPVALFGEIGQLLFATESPSLRAALYHSIKLLPSVTVLGSRTDRLGRHGIDLGITNNGTRSELIFDPTTGDILQTQVVIAGEAPRVPSSLPPLPAGTVTAYKLFIARGIVDSPNQLPRGANGPYMAGERP